MSKGGRRVIGPVVLLPLLLQLFAFVAQAREPVNELPFRRNYEAALREAHISGKPLVIFFEAGFIENFVSFDNTPDVGFYAGFRQRF